MDKRLPIPKIKVLKFPINAFSDERGIHVKPFYKNSLEAINEDMRFGEVKEIFFTRSKRNVIRGMHFTMSPNNLNKIIFVVEGEILDVCIELNSDVLISKKTITNLLSADKPQILFVPHGFAHGYKVLSKYAVIMYVTDGDFDSKLEFSINPLSIPYDWNIKDPIISRKDISAISLNDFLTKSF